MNWSGVVNVLAVVLCSAAAVLNFIVGNLFLAIAMVVLAAVNAVSAATIGRL